MSSIARRSRGARSWLGCSRGRLLRGGGLVALVASAAYLPSLGHGFIYDDYWTVVGNRHLDKPLSELLRAAASGRSVEWKMPDATRPTLGLSLWLDRQLFGLSAAGHHLQSLVLYALVSVLGFWLAFALLRSFAAALAAGLAFAVMPLHSEVVSAVNYREDLLAALGVFAALVLCFWPVPRAEKGWPYATAALWFYALASKESALCAPLLLLALASVRRLARWTWQGPLALAGSAVLALWVNWRFGLSVLGEQIPRADYGSWLERGLRTARYELWSLYNSLLPLRARPEHDPWSEPSWLWAVAGLPLLALLVALGRRRRTRPALGVLCVALLAPLVTSPLLAPTNETADRYCFVGSLAAALVVGWVFRKLARAQALLALALLVSMTSAGLWACWSATSVWQSEVSLWTFAAQSAPLSPRSWSSLSRVHRMADQADLAERTIQRSLALKPEYVPALVARALNLLWQGDRTSARRVLSAVVPKSDLHRDALNVASHCAFLPTDAAARECARRAVPKGMVLGDPELLRGISERLLAE